MSISFVALVFLFGAIALGFVKKSNVGLISLGAVLVLGKLGKLPVGKLYGGFPGKLFLTLLGTMFFFALLQENGTLDKASKKLTRLCGTKVFLVPIVIYLVSFVLSAIGPGAISVQTVMVLFAVPWPSIWMPVPSSWAPWLSWEQWEGPLLPLPSPGSLWGTCWAR